MAALAAAAHAGGWGGCYGPLTDGRGTTVEIRDLCFGPAILHVDRGKRVTWINQDGFAHNVKGASSSWGSFDQLDQHDTASFTFSRDGVYPYPCMFHPGMVGAVVVGDPTGPGNAKIRTIEVAGVTEDLLSSPLPPVRIVHPVRGVSKVWRTRAIAGIAVTALALGVAIAAVARARRHPAT